MLSLVASQDATETPKERGHRNRDLSGELDHPRVHRGRGRRNQTAAPEADVTEESE